MGKFGKTAADKTRTIGALNGAEREMRYNLGRYEKYAPLSEATKRADQITTAWRGLRDVGDDARLKYQPSEVQGWLGDAKQKVETDSLKLLASFPDAELQRLHDEVQMSFMQQLENVNRSRILNDDNLKTLFDVAKGFESEVEKKAYHGLSINTRFSLAIKDALAGIINPAENRFAFLQLFRAAQDMTITGWQKLFGSGEAMYQSAGLILTNHMADIAKIANRRTDFMRGVTNLVTSVFNLDNIKKVGREIPTRLYGYETRMAQAESMREIESKYDKISANIRAMQQNPSLYAERLNVALSPLMEYAPDIADQGMKSIFSTLALVKDILPEKETGTYKTLVPLSAKAKFLDNFEALTDPMKMLEMMASNTINKDQLDIFRTTKPDMWNKIQTRLRQELFEKNPPQEVRSRIYSMYGIGDPESASNAQYIGQRLFQDFMAQKPVKQMSPRKSFSVNTQLKGLTAPNSLTPQGINR